MTYSLRGNEQDLPIDDAAVWFFMPLWASSNDNAIPEVPDWPVRQTISVGLTCPC